MQLLEYGSQGRYTCRWESDQQYVILKNANKLWVHGWEVFLVNLSTEAFRHQHVVAGGCMN